MEEAAGAHFLPLREPLIEPRVVLLETLTPKRGSEEAVALEEAEEEEEIEEGNEGEVGRGESVSDFSPLPLRGLPVLLDFDLSEDDLSEDLLEEEEVVDLSEEEDLLSAEDL